MTGTYELLGVASASQGASGLSVTNIPQTFDDLEVIFCLQSTSNNPADFKIVLNNSSSSWYLNSVFGMKNATGFFDTGSGQQSGWKIYGGVGNGATGLLAKSQSFVKLYIPDYTEGGGSVGSLPFWGNMIGSIITTSGGNSSYNNISFSSANTDNSDSFPVVSVASAQFGNSVTYQANSFMAVYGISRS
tara:strand:+ start:1585 stop:2151 length:567 start_codon:yes stop_codon:yes gene_type:complete